MGGELDGVADEVVKDLADPLGVDHQQRQFGAFGAESDIVLCGALAEHREEFADELVEVGRLRHDLHAFRLDLRQVEHVVDERQQGVAGIEHGFEVFLSLLGRDVVVLKQLGEPDHGVQRRAYLVTHGGQERALVAGGGQRGVAVAAHLGVDDGALQHDLHEPGHGLQQPEIVLGETHLPRGIDHRQRPEGLPQHAKTEDIIGFDVELFDVASPQAQLVQRARSGGVLDGEDLAAEPFRVRLVPVQRDGAADAGVRAVQRTVAHDAPLAAPEIVFHHDRVVRPEMDAQHVKRTLEGLLHAAAPHQGLETLVQQLFVLHDPVLRLAFPREFRFLFAPLERQRIQAGHVVQEPDLGRVERMLPPAIRHLQAAVKFAVVMDRNGRHRKQPVSGEDRPERGVFFGKVLRVVDHDVFPAGQRGIPEFEREARPALGRIDRDLAERLIGGRRTVEDGGVVRPGVVQDEERGVVADDGFAGVQHLADELIERGRQHQVFQALVQERFVPRPGLQVTPRLVELGDVP